MFDLKDDSMLDLGNAEALDFCESALLIVGLNAFVALMLLVIFLMLPAAGFNVRQSGDFFANAVVILVLDGFDVPSLRWSTGSNFWQRSSAAVGQYFI